MSNQAAQLAARLELARRIAHEAGRLTLRYFQNPDLAVELKQDLSPVTVADREAEKLLRQRIEASFPADGIVGEEFGEQTGTSSYRWVLDPIDGTKSFIHGVPLYGTLVAVEQEGCGMLGVIEIPALRESVYAARESGAWYMRGDETPRRAHVSECKRLADGLFCTSEVKSFAVRAGGQGMAAYEALQASARLTRTWGDCYGYLLVATGRAEVMVDPIMNLWDAAAVAPIIEEAGGTFTDWQGLPRLDGGDGVATNGHVFEEVMAKVMAMTRGR